jgi:general stress protein CsbA
MTIYYLSDLVWKDSISGINTSMACFFVAASVYTMVISTLNHRDRGSVFSWVFPFVLSVIFSAIAILTRYIAIAVVPGIVLYAWLMNGRLRGGTRFALVFIGLCLLMISPWLYRNYTLSGSPVGMAGHTALAETAKYPDNAFERQLHPEFTKAQVIAQLKQKWVLNYSEKYNAVIPGLGGGILMGLFVTTFFYRFVRPQVNYLRWGLGLSLLLMIFIAGFFSETSIDMIHVFWPFIILYGLAFFYILIDRLDLGVRIYVISLKCLIVVLSLLPILLTIMPPHATPPYPPYYAPIIGQVTGMLTEREVMCTDMPWATAWYGDRVSILLPKDIDDFYEINDLKQYISGMYITTITKNKPFVKQLLDGPEKSWLPIISGRTPPDFPLKHGVSLNRQDQIFLSDRNRWSTGAEAAGGPQQ